MAKFKRLVYTPKAYAFIWSRRDNTTVDVSNDITAGSVQRFVNKPSSATLTLRNDDWKYTGKFNPMFFPMDGITIWLQRVAGHPIQVFTGYIDSIPYYQAYPGPIEIKATCTLKKFLYTHFDPGVGFLNWLSSKGWAPNANGNIDGFFNPEALQTGSDQIGTDSGMGKLLHDFLIEIGGLDPNAIAIGDLPAGLPETMLSAYYKRVKASKAAEKELIPALKAFLSPSVSHTADASPDVVSRFPTGIAANANSNDIKALLKSVDNFNKRPKPDHSQILLAGLVMSGLDSKWSGTNTDSPSKGQGYFAANTNVASTASGLDGLIGGMTTGGSNAGVQSPAAQGKAFCEKWYAYLTQSSSQVSASLSANINGDMTDQMIVQVAQVLAYSYNKEKFYGQILESCRDAINLSAVREIKNHINTNRSLDDVKTLDVLTAGEVAQETLISRVTWAELFPSDTPAPTDIIKINRLGKGIDSDGVVAETKPILSSGTIYSTDFTFIPHGAGTANIIQEKQIPLFKKSNIKYSEIKHYIIAQGDGGPAAAQGGTIGERVRFDANGIQKYQIMTVRYNGKSCKCLYLGAYLYDTARVNTVFTISEDVLSVLGIGNKKEKDVIKDIAFEFDASTNTPLPKSSDTRDSYIARITSGLGSSNAASDNSSITSNINSADQDTYKKRYTNSNDRLAEYFYFASKYGMHLYDGDPGADTIAFYGQDTTSALSFLIDLGLVDPTSTASRIVISGQPQSVPQEANIYLISGSNTIKMRIGFNLGRSEAKGWNSTIDPDSSGQASLITIKATMDQPRPLRDGTMARLPNGTNTDPTQNPAATGTGPQSWSDFARISTSAAFSTLTQFPFDLVGSQFLIGDKSLMNDIPIMQGMEQLCKGSMRHYMSLPNGMFCAFYPDYFGQFGRLPYMSVSDLEITDLNIVLSDESIVTHMYVNGNTTNPLTPSVDQINQVLSVGVITIDDVFQKSGLNFIDNPNAVTGVTSAGEYGVSNVDLQNGATPDGAPQFYEGIGAEAKAFLETYGTRPKVINEPLIRSPWFEFVTAYNEFAFNWTMHTATTVGLTFMPEMMAGGIVSLEDHNINMYVEAVTHTWNYESGFETSAYLSAPTTNREGEVPGLVIFGRRG